MIRFALCNAPPAIADSLARKLVDDRIAACVNVSAPIRSVYRWNGAVETGAEVTLAIKIPEENIARLHAFIAREHPYELPEILVLAIDEAHSSARYLAWVREVTLDAE